MIKTKVILSVMLGCLLAFSAIACNPTGGESPNESSMSSSSSKPGNTENTDNSSDIGKEDTKDKILKNSEFTNPSLADRPMVMMHRGSTTLIDDAYSRGYGGIVTNVTWDSSYLQSDRAFSVLSSSVQHAASKGMHVWLYDEYGYPSGSAYGQTLKDNPEYEALGLVPQYKEIPAGSTGKIDILYGHTRIETAYIYEGNLSSGLNLSTGQNVSSAIAANGKSVSYTNRSAQAKVLVAYSSKPWYENTHAMENWYIQQRYINMLDADPAQKFISITHDKYYEKLSSYFGNTIQAFFTDEPALQGNYFNLSDRNRIVLDTPDMNIPIVECLNYSNSLFDKFEAKYGYDLPSNLAYLYMDDDSVKAKQVRMDFYALTGELFGNNYLGAIEEWCAEKNVKSSGHLLLEETLYQNPWFAGNMLQLLGEMGIPGSDLLYSEPLGAMNAACIISKMAASAAEYTGKENTFSEISGAFDGTKGDLYDQINAVGAQICMGVNTYASYYYQGGNHTLEEDKVFSTALGRMRYMTTGVNHSSKVAVYYPYEGVSAETLPSKNMYEPTTAAKNISDSFSNLCRTLVGKQVDYDLVDYLNLSKCTVSRGKLVSPSGEAYGAVVIPYTTALHSTAVEKLLEAAKAGVKVVLTGIDEIVCETGKNATVAKFNELYSLSKYVTTENGAANYLRDNGYSYMSLNDKYAENVFMSKRENENYSVFTVVNGYESNKTYEFTLEAEGSKVRYYDSVSGEIKAVPSVAAANGKCTFSYTIPANRTVFFVVEK